MNIYDELKRDHREITAMLNELTLLGKDDDYRYFLIAEIRTALLAHSRAEEAVFYNSLRAADEDLAKKARGSYREHLEIETLLRGLQFMDRLDANWKPLARKLRDQVAKHIREEESVVFELGQGIFSEEQEDRMGELFRRLKPQIEQEGDAQTTVDMMINLLPPKYAAKALANTKSF